MFPWFPPLTFSLFSTDPEQSVQELMYDLRSQCDAIRVTKTVRPYQMVVCPVNENNAALMVSDGRVMLWELKAHAGKSATYSRWIHTQPYGFSCKQLWNVLCYMFNKSCSTALVAIYSLYRIFYIQVWQWIVMIQLLVHTSFTCLESEYKRHSKCIPATELYLTTISVISHFC